MGALGLVSAQLHIVDRPVDERGVVNDHWGLVDDPGAMWRIPDWDKDGRECWAIVLPNRAGIWWTTYRAGNNTDGPLWEVTGEPPNITVNPSINAGDGPGPHNWHGWIKDGVMTP
jgi:hypothetical protein